MPNKTEIEWHSSQNGYWTSLELQWLEPQARQCIEDRFDELLCRGTNHLHRGEIDSSVCIDHELEQRLPLDIAVAKDRRVRGQAVARFQTLRPGYAANR